MLLTKQIFVFFLLLLSFCSCSNEISIQEAKEEASATIVDIEALKSDDVISDSDYTIAIQNIVSYEQRSFIGKYWWVLVFVVIWFFIVGTMYMFTDTSSSRECMSKPMSKSNCYGVLLLTGILGGHFLYLNKLKWLTWLTLLLLIAIPLLDYKEIMYFYNIINLLFIHRIEYIHLPHLGLFYSSQLALGSLFLANIVIGLIFIPFWVYQYNGNYFRKHVDNDAILEGRKLEIDIFYNNQLVPNVNKTNKDADEINKIIKDENYIEYNKSDDKISGFFKNIFTLGKSSNLKYKVGRLRALRHGCGIISDDISQFENDNNRLYDFLNYYRIAAYRNLYLAKELISVVKDKISSQQQILIKDEFPMIIAPKNHNLSETYFDSSSISFNSNAFFDSVGATLTSSFDNLNAKLKKEQNLSKDDFIDMAIEVGINTLISAIDELFSMNSKINDELRKIESSINDALVYLDKALPAINRYQAELLRQSEITISLSQCNKAFVMAYEPLRQQVFGQPTFKKFLLGLKKDENVLNSDNFRNDLLHLIKVCTEYNKVYNAKTGKDNEKKSSIQSQLSTSSSSITSQNVLTIIRENIKKPDIEEGCSIAYLDFDKKTYTKSALCIRLNDTFKTRLKPHQLQQFKTVKELIDYVIQNNSL